MDIHLTINGESYTVNTSQVPITDQSLNSFIRQHASLTGTKVMCREGGCGACVVTVGRTHPATKVYETFAVNSCLKPLYSCTGIDITTIEGLGDRRRGYHPLQKRIDELSGTQCGYCTPGMIMNMHGLMSSAAPLSMVAIERGFSGNTCRCTGYRPILDAFKSFARDATADLVNKCRDSNSDLTVDIEDLTGYCPKISSKCASLPCHQRSSVVTDDCKVWHRVTTLPDLLIALNAVPDNLYMLVAGNSAQGITRTPANIHTFIDITPIAEMHTVQRTSASLTLGSLVTLNETLTAMSESAAVDGFKYLNDLYKHFELIANVPVRNVATLGGNLNYKQKHLEFPSDVFVTLDTVDARLTIVDAVSHQRSSVTMTQFLAMSMHQKVLYNIVLPRIESDTLFRSYKIMVRAQNTHAYVNAGFCIRLSRDGKVVSARICYGGINPNFTHASNTERMLLGRELFNNKTMQDAFASLDAELRPDWVLPDATPEYRKNLALALFYRFILSTCPKEKLRGINTSGAEALQRDLSSGIQSFKTVEKNWPLTKPVEKYEGLQQTSGESKYINDIPPLAGELWAAFAVATKVRSIVVSIDAKEALALPGVRFFYGAQDIPGANNFTPIAVYTTEVEQIFLPIGGKVLFNGQPVGIVLADTFKKAVDAAQLVKITYRSSTNEQEMGLFSLARSLLAPLVGEKENTIYPTIHDLPRDRLHAIPSIGTNAIRGRFELQGQYHFHMETQCAVVVPDEKELAVYSSTQWMDFTQNAIAASLSMPANRINMVIRRLGGAYGAKISRATQIACAAALGAHKTNRPVRFSMALEANMKSIGKRSGIVADYAVEVDATTGRVTKMTNHFSQDAGCSLNEPLDAVTAQLFSNCYDSTGWSLQSAMVLTDAPSNTYCRSPSTLEGIAMVEAVMEHIAFETGLDAMAVRRSNMTADNPMRQMSIDFVKAIDFDVRRAACDDFNAKNRWHKRGIAVLPMQWPASYWGVIPGYVAIYHSDGTVAVTHGGIECGQGINTKVAQVAAFALGVPLDSISVKPMDNVSSANAALTGSSVTSEMACYAIKKTCELLMERIKPIRDTMPAGYTWPDLIAQCYAQNIDLRATCQFKDSDVPPYNIYGMCAAEVHLDVLTGNCQLARVDIWEDVGESMSPHVDVGQVEGAFVMGIGYYLTEELVYERTTGELLTDRTWNYKTPGALDIPVDFRITFIQKSPNPTGGVLRSKATGEPAICMSIVMLFALRNAINSARKDAGLPKEWVPLGSATTPEVTFLKCGNKFGDFVL